MNKYYITFLFFFLSFQLFAQSAQTLWSKTYGGSKSDFIERFKQTSDNGYIGIGLSRSNDGDVPNNAGGTDIWVIKLDFLGNLQWSKTYGGVNWDYGLDIFELSNGNFAAFCSLSQDATMIELTPNGNVNSNNIIGSGGYDEIYQVIKTTNEDFVMAGKTNQQWGGNSNLSGKNAWLSKVSNTGNVLWTKAYGGSGIDHIGTIQETSDGGYIVGGRTNSLNGDISTPYSDEILPNSSNKAWILKLDSIGTIEWEKRYYGQYAYGITTTPDGGYIFTTDEGALILTKIDSIGNILWRKSYPSIRLGSSHESGIPIFVGNKFQETNQGNYIGPVRPTGIFNIVIPWTTPSLYSQNPSNLFSIIDTAGNIIDYHSTANNAPYYSFQKQAVSTFENNNSNIILGSSIVLFDHHTGSDLNVIIEEITMPVPLAVVDVKAVSKNSISQFNLLENDIKSSNDSLVITSFFSPTNNNNINILNDSTVEYTASNNIGVDFFYYEVCKYTSGSTICDNGLVIIYIDLPVSNNDITHSIENEVKIFPQPAQGAVTIQLNAQNENINQIQIYDTQGRLIKNIDNLDTTEQSINIDNFDIGFYFVLINNKYSQKLIKQ